MESDFERLMELSLLMSKGASAIDIVETIADVLDALEDKELTKAEAISAIQEIVGHYLSLERIQNLSSENLLELLEADTNAPNPLRAGVKKLKPSSKK
jgi:hypothetical protein